MKQKTNQDRLHELATVGVGRLLWRYSVPSVIGMLVMALYNVVDRVILGQVVGPTAIAGLTVTFPVMNLTTAIGVLVGVGACTRVSILLGEKRFYDAGRVLGNALVLTLINGAIYLTLFAIFMDDLLLLFGASSATLPYARDFMMWILPGLLMINLSFGFNNIMRASGYPIKAMFTMIIGAGLNIVLAPVFVYWLDMGIKGAAIATDISMFVSMAFVMSHFTSKKSTLHFTRGIYGLRLRTIWAIVSIGAAPSIVNAASCLINIIINHALYANGGDNAIATAGIFVTYTSLITTVVLGLNMGMQPILGYNYGAGNLGRLKRTLLLASFTATLICTLGQIGGQLAPDMIARAFSGDATLISVTAASLPVAMTCFFTVGIQIISTGFFQSIGKAGKSIILSLTRQVLFLIPLLLTLPSMFGLRGVWMSFPASDVCAFCVTVLLLWIQLRSLERNSAPVAAAR